MPQNNAAYLDPLRAHGYGDSIMAKISEYSAMWKCRTCFNAVELDGDVSDCNTSQNKLCKVCGKKTRQFCYSVRSNAEWIGENNNG